MHKTQAGVLTTALSEGLSTEQDQPPTPRLVVSRRSTLLHRPHTTAKEPAWTLPSFILVCIYCLFIVGFLDLMSFLSKDMVNITSIFC